MLLIKRKPRERITIGGDVEVVVLEVTRLGVVLGIEAPREIEIRREGPLERPAKPASNGKRKRRVVIS
jgi:carbon storage regulator CsrA